MRGAASSSFLFPSSFLPLSFLFLSSFFPLSFLFLSSFFPLSFLFLSSFFPLSFLFLSSFFPLSFLFLSSSGMRGAASSSFLFLSSFFPVSATWSTSSWWIRTSQWREARGAKRSGMSCNRGNRALAICLIFLVFGLADATDSIAMNPAVTSLDSSFQQSLLGLFLTFSAIVALPIPALCAAYDCHDRRKLVSPLVCLHWVLRTRFDALLVLLSCYHPISGMRCLFHCEFAFLRADELCPHLPHIRPQMPDRFDRVTFDLCLPRLAPMRVLCIAGFGPGILSPGICPNNPLPSEEWCWCAEKFGAKDVASAGVCPGALTECAMPLALRSIWSIKTLWTMLMRISTACKLCGGAHVTKRKRNQKEFLNGLKELLEKIAEPNAKLCKITTSEIQDIWHTLRRSAENGDACTAKPSELVAISDSAGPTCHWWQDPASIAAVSQIRQTLENGHRPTASLVAMMYEQATELKMLVQAHELADIKVAAILLSGACPDSFEKKWVHVHQKGHGPEIKKYPVVPLGHDLPTFPTCQVSAAALPETPIHAVTLRVTIPFCFCRHSWRNCQSKPANVISGMPHLKSLPSSGTRPAKGDRSPQGEPAPPPAPPSSTLDWLVFRFVIIANACLIRAICWTIGYWIPLVFQPTLAIISLMGRGHWRRCWKWEQNQ